MDEKQGRQAQLLRMADALRAAADRADWERLGEHARGLASQLRALAARGPWSPAERLALQRLRGAHDDAARAAAVASDALARRLEELRNNKDGWLAYAMHGDTVSGASHA